MTNNGFVKIHFKPGVVSDLARLLRIIQIWIPNRDKTERYIKLPICRTGTQRTENALKIEIFVEPIYIDTVPVRYCGSVIASSIILS